MAGAAGDIEKCVGPQHAAAGMPPAQEGFEGAHAPLLGLHDRLIFQEEFVVAHACGDLFFETGVLVQGATERRRVEDMRGACHVLCDIERGVGAAQQVADRLVGLFDIADADRHAAGHTAAAEVIGLGRRRLDHPAEPFDVAVAGFAGDGHDEFVAAQAEDAGERPSTAARRAEKTRSNSSPASWPSMSLTCLNLSRSINSMAGRKRPCRLASMKRSISSSRARRFATPVRRVAQ